MNRRRFLASAAALTALPTFVQAEAFTAYRPGLERELLEAGHTVLLDFKASWCSTCAAQERAITALRAENPAYDQTITFVAVDWDIYGTAQISERLRIPRRSTLVLLRGDQELGRIVAQTSQRDIRKLLDLALVES